MNDETKGEDLLSNEQQSFMEARILKQKQLRQIVLKTTTKNHWIIQGDKAYLEHMGCCAVARALGMGLKPDNPVEGFEEDEKGSYYSFTTACTVSLNGESVTQFGYADARDDFFSHGGRLPISEINKGNIKKKSVTNSMNRAIMDFLGVDFSKEEIEKQVGKITRAIDRNSKPKEELTADQIDLKNEVKLKIWLMTGKDEEAFKAYLKNLTAWPEKNFEGHTDINKVSVKNLAYKKKQVEADFKKWEAANESN